MTRAFFQVACAIACILSTNCRRETDGAANKNEVSASSGKALGAASAPSSAASSVARTAAVPTAVAAAAVASASNRALAGASPDGGGRCPEGMIYIAGATFTMGAANPKDDPIEADYIEDDRMDSTVDERPAHRAEVKAFCIDRTEVTTAAYTACVQRQRCQAPVPPSESAACNYGVIGRENHPINCVSWIEAQKFCLSQGWGLPSEREWEYAARGKDKRWYPWGNKDPHTDRNRYCGLNVHATTCPVASHPESVSPFGVEDMIGNVREWTTNSICKYPNDDCVKPDDDRVYRGAAFKGSSLKDRVTSRFHAPDDFRSDELGFRCAATPRP